MLGIKIWKEWGPSSIDRIEKDPYLLASAAIGVEFEQADEIALSLGIDKEDGRRLKAGLIYVLEHNEQNGHTCLPYEKLCQTAAAFLEVGINQAEDMLDTLIEQEIFFTKQIDKRDYVYLCEVYNAERYIAGRLCMAVKGYRFTNRSYEQDIAELEKTLHIQYAALQREAIVSSLNSGVFI